MERIPDDGERYDGRQHWNRLAARLGALTIRAVTLLGQSFDAYNRGSTAAMRGSHLFGHAMMPPLDLQPGRLVRQDAAESVAAEPVAAEPGAEPVADVSGLTVLDAEDVRYLFEEHLTGHGLHELIGESGGGKHIEPRL